jgi:hypothetical protein
MQSKFIEVVLFTRAYLIIQIYIWHLKKAPNLYRFGHFLFRRGRDLARSSGTPVSQEEECDSSQTGMGTNHRTDTVDQDGTV